MKKTYLKPQTMAMVIHHESSILASSGPDPKNPKNKEGAWWDGDLPEGWELD